jgi:hypothetical protein
MTGDLAAASLRAMKRTRRACASGRADANFSLLHRTALSLLKNNTSQKVGVKNKRLSVAWNDDYRLEVLSGT